ncbi:MAG: MMPL family transporter [Desulfobacteraceae bacterium]|nr:MMPL family transporter [Desulfobacteraceae bacterium]
MEFLSRCLQIWMSWILRWPRLVLGIALVSALASVAYTAAKLEMLTDQLELIAKDHPLIALSDRLDPFNAKMNRRFDVVIEAPSPYHAISFVKELSRRVEGDTDRFEAFVYRVDPEPLKSWQMLYLDKKDLVAFKEKIDTHASLIENLTADPELLGFLKALNKEMASRVVGELFTGFLDGEKSKEADEEPFDLSFLIATLEGMSSFAHGIPFFKSPWASLLADASRDLELEGYFWESNRRFLIAFATPRKSEDGIIVTQESLVQLRKHIQEVQVSFPEVKAGVTGQEALNNDEMSTVLDDMAVATWLSIVAVFLLLVLFRRSFRRPVLQGLSLCVGLSWSFGCATLFVGHLNMLSVVFAPLLCGLGVDSGIHWYSRLEEEERTGRSRMDAIIRIVNERSGPGILLAGLGTTLSFLPFMLTGFRALVELGLITGMGILLNLVADFSVLPALTLLFGEHKKQGPSSVMDVQPRDFVRLSPRTSRMVLWGAGTTALFCLLGASQVYFDLNPLRLQTVSAESVIWEKTLIENSQHSALFASSFAGSPEEAKAKSKTLEALPSVSEVQSIFTLLPEDQEEKIPLLRALQPGIPAIRPTVLQPKPSDRDEFIEVLERIRFKLQEEEARKEGAEKTLVEQMARTRALASEIIVALRNSPGAMDGLLDYRGRFLEDLTNKWDTLLKGVNASPMKMEDLPGILRGWFYQNGTFLLRILPKESVWEEHALSRFVKEVQSVDPEAVGDPVSLYVFATAFRNACINASAFAVIAIFILLALTFRNLRLTLLAFVPLALGSVWTVGIMGFADIQFNLANSMFMPLVVGAGVEYSIIILSRWREGRMWPGHLPLSTTKGVVLAALTTTAGFGALMISNHRGIFSLGFIAWAGSLCVLVSAVVILPAIFGSCYRKAARE